jgi:hypothetical protein
VAPEEKTPLRVSYSPPSPSREYITAVDCLFSKESPLAETGKEVTGTSEKLEFSSPLDGSCLATSIPSFWQRSSAFLYRA